MSGTSGGAFDIERELAELRERAYGPAPDIDGDPAAAARLAELEDRHRHAVAEARHTGFGSSEATIASSDEPRGFPTPQIEDVRIAEAGSPLPGASPRSGVGRRAHRAAWRRTRSRSLRSVLLALVAGVVTAAVVCGVYWALAPRPAAILQAGAQTDVAPAADRWIVLSSEDGVFMDRTVDQQSLTPYGAFHGVAVWSGVDELDNPCLILIEESSDRTLQAACTPGSGELIADIGVWGGDEDFAGDLPRGSIIRFRHLGATVEAWIIEAADVPKPPDGRGEFAGRV